MPTATNMAQLEKMLMMQMSRAMKEVNRKVKDDMFKHTGEFYSQGNPVLYKRTSALLNSPHTTSVDVNGYEASFTAYLQPYAYKVPNEDFIKRGFKSYFSGEQVLGAAEVGQAHILGKPGFWQRSLVDMKKELMDTIPKYFT